ncbi:NrdH-redoxin [archaeon]|nr:NrdH-redoxin [archaeon]|tara:strand:+ start:831 stop:1067 length:237 start_codon:yes stop_codon:yes gene_type:complete
MAKIIVYSTESCPYCHQLKDFLKKNKIKFTNIDVSKDKEKSKEMIDKSGQMGVPVMDIDGKIIIGFDKEKIKKELKLT